MSTPKSNLKLPSLPAPGSLRNKKNSNHHNNSNEPTLEELEDPNWRANELRKRVIQRREIARGKETMELVKKQHLADKRKRAIVQKWKDKQIREKAKVSEHIRGFEKKTMNFLERAEVQWSLDIKLRALDRTVTSTTTNIRDALAKLNESEKRIHAAREKIARPHAKEPTVEERIELELMRDRPKTIVSTVSGQKVAIEKLKEHEENWVDPRHGNKYVLEDLRPIPEQDDLIALKEKVSECQYCSRRMLTSIFKEHEKACLDARNNERRIRYGRRIEVKGAQAMDCCVPPQRPRQFRCGKVTHNSIELLWEPPVFDGGTFIADYVISMDITTKKLVGKKVKRVYTAMPIISCSRWNIPLPMAHNGFIIRGLESGTEYAHIKVAALNGVGRSPWTHEIEKCLTLPPEPPSRPLFLRVNNATSRTIDIQWIPPLHFGGGDQKNLTYEICFTNTVIIENAVSKATSRRRKRTKIITGDSKTQYTIKGLLGDDKVAQITVRAINIKSKLKSVDSEAIEQVLTDATDVVQDIDEEIERIRTIEAQLVDTTFYQGFAQQFTKEEALLLLSQRREEQLQKLQEEEAREAKREIGGGLDEELDEEAKRRRKRLKEEEERKENEEKKNEAKKNIEDAVAAASAAAAAANGEGDDGKDAAAMMAEFQKNERARETQAQRNERLAAERLNRIMDMREKHFQWKLKSYENKIRDVEDKRIKLQNRRHDIVWKLKAWSKRVAEVRPELDRADNFRGEFMDSSVLHHKAQHFLTEGLRLTLAEELHKHLRKIALSKQAAIDMEKETVKLVARRKYLEDKQSERVAAHHAFLHERTRIERARNKMKQWMKSAKKQFWNRWLDYVDERREEKLIVGKFFKRFFNKELQMGWNKWISVLRQQDINSMEQANVLGGAGSKALVVANGHRQELQAEIQDLLSSVCQTDATLESSKRSASQLRELESSSHYEAEYKIDLEPKESPADMADFFRGQLYEEKGEWKRAIAKYMSFSNKMQENGNLHQMTKVWNRLGHVFAKMHEPEKAYVHFDRSRQLAKECRSTSGVGKALLGLGEANEMQAQHRDALRMYDRAVHYFLETKDSIGVAKCYRASQRSYAAMNNVEGRDYYKKLADEIEFQTTMNVNRVGTAMSELRRRLVGATASSTDPLPIERVAAPVPRIREEIREKKYRLAKLEKKLALNEHHVEENQKRLLELKDQEKRAFESESQYFDANSVHGSVQRFKLFEFREFVKVAQEKVVAVLNGKLKASRTLRTRISNTNDDLDEIYERLDTENGGLMKRILGNDDTSSPLRFVCFNPSNTRGNDVLGECTGGINRFVAASGKRWFAFDMNGTCYRTTGGDEEGKHLGPPVSHTRAITAMCFYNRRIYTGSLDCTCRVWELETHDCVHTLIGHKGAISCIDADAFKIVSASSDLQVRIWSALAPFKCLQIVVGHTRSVLCVHKPPGAFFVTGSSDCEVKVWKIIGTSFKPVKRVICRHSMLGHCCAVTAVQMSAAEVVSGGADGKIIIWSADDGTRLRTMEAHKGSVMVLRFDVIKIISGGSDQTIATHDMATGSKLQTLHGHNGAVIALEFDQSKIVSASMDSVMRRWPFQGYEQKIAPVKFHIVEPNDTLPKLAKKFGITIKNIKEWNNIDQAKEMYNGRRIMVKNGTRKQDERIDNSPAYILRQPKLKAQDLIPIQERHQMNLSPERAQELAKAGSDAMDAMDGLNRAFDGKQGEIKERVGELKILVAASTNAGILNKNRKK
jgi:COMPASS component SWD3